MIDYLHSLMYSYFSTLVLLAGFIVIYVRHSKLDKSYRRATQYTLVVTIIVTILTDIEYYLTVQPNQAHWAGPRAVLSFLTYSLRPFIVVGFILILACTLEEPDKQFIRKRIQPAIFAVLGLNVAIYLPMLRNSWPVYYDEDGFHRDSIFGFTSIIVSLVLIILMLIFSLHYYKKYQKGSIKLLFCCGIFSIMASFMDMVKPEYHNITKISIIAIVLIFSQLYVAAVNDDSEAKELTIKQAGEALMMSQIRPHFLYNTLGTIEVLCHDDPKLAAETVSNFSKYLRGNMDMANNNELTPITKELDHVETYVAIEELRFDNIHVEYVIEDVDFKIPPLSIQTLTENAIKYGIRARERGIVTITTKRIKQYEAIDIVNKYSGKLNARAKEWHMVMIQDNGLGFDVAKLDNQEGLHLGVNNVLGRVQDMCQGNMFIESTIDVGTTIVILIPEME